MEKKETSTIKVGAHEFVLAFSTKNAHYINRDSLLYICLVRSSDDRIDVLRDEEVGRFDRKFKKVGQFNNFFESVNEKLIERIIKSCAR